MKHLWQAGKKSTAFDTLSHFVTLQAQVGSAYSAASMNGLGSDLAPDTVENDKLLARSVSNAGVAIAVEVVRK